MDGQQVTQVQPYYGQQGSPMAFLTFPHNMTSPTTTFSPLASTAPQIHGQGMQYHYHPSTTDINWPNRILPPPPVKAEPVEPEQHVYYDTQSAHSPGQPQRYISQSFRYHSTPMYPGRLHLQAPPNQMIANQQNGRAYGNDINAYLTASEVSQYNWQQQQQQQYAHRYQSSRSSFSSSMLEQTISTDSTATLAPGDAMKPSSPASSASCGKEPAPMADVSIIFHPSTYPQIQSGNLQAGAAFVSPMDVQDTRHLVVPEVTSPSLCSTDWSSYQISLPNADPPVAASPLREIQGDTGTDYSSDTLQEISYSEHEDSDSDEDADFEEDDEDDDEKHGGQGVMTASIHGYRVQSLLDMPAATSNLRNNPANDGVTDPTRLPPRLPAFASDLPRAAAKAASKKITALSKPGGAEYAEETDEPKTKAKPSPKRKRTTKAKPKATTLKKRAITVTSAAVCRVPNPIPNYQINKKSRGRTVTTDPNEIDSNVVHVCPVPSCGACFKRREHVKRHIRGLHTEDKPYDCRFPGCKSTFTRGDNLKGHYIKVHKTTIEKLYEELDLPLL